VEEDGVPNGWDLSVDEHTYDSETIYELVNGQADAYFAYNFERVTVRTYQNQVGDTVDAEVWRVASSGDAYGLFTSNRAGDPVEIGNGGDEDPGRRVAFWQNQYYVRIRARQEIADDSLREFAASVAASLPEGGARPQLVGRLPSDGRLQDSEIYFHLESSIQDEVWLGGDNILGLDLGTQGVMARYQIGGATARLLLLEFGDVGSASAAREALDMAAVDGLVAAGTDGGLVAAVFGDATVVDSRRLVADALTGG
jgi:hypothetical protein